jgi:hypothetical protein
MPLSKVSYPYVDPLRITNANIESLFTNAQTFASPFIVQSNSPTATALVARGATSQSADIFQVQNSVGSTLLTVGNGGNTVFSGGVNIFVGDVRVGTTNYFSGALSVSARVSNEIGAVVRGFAGQTSSLQEWQDSAGSVQSAVASDGTFSIKQIRNVGGNVNRLVLSDASSTVIVNAGNTNFVGLSVRRFNDSQTSDLQQWTNSGGGTVYTRIDKDGNIGIATVPLADLHIGGVGTVSDFRMGNSVNNTVLNMYTASNDVVIYNATASGTLQLGTNSATRLTLSADGTTATFTGAVIAPAATTAIPSLRAPHGTAPSAPTNGDIWTTTTGLFVRINGTTVSPILNPMTTQLQSTLAWNATTAQGQIYLNGATGNRIDFNLNGVAAPAFTTRSAGTKIVLYPSLSGSAADYALGIESGTLWQTVEGTSQAFKWYGGTTLAATLTGAGALTLTSSITTGGALNLNYASPTISSNNASAATIFGATVTGVTIGTSAIKTTVYPAEPSGTTSGTVTQSAQLSGTKGMPINPRGAAGVALAYTLTASDAGKMIYVSSTPTTPTITIPANTAVAFEIGTTIVVMNDIGAATNVSIAITTDTLQLVSTGAVGTRTLARYGMATLVKVTATKWIITGNGVT